MRFSRLVLCLCCAGCIGLMVCDLSLAQRGRGGGGRGRRRRRASRCSPFTIDESSRIATIT